MYTVNEARELLQERADYIEVLELLNITVADLVDRFDDRIEENLEEVQEYLDEYA